MLDLTTILARQRAFSLATFGPDYRPQQAIDHIVRELTEIEADPRDIKEWIDVAIIGLDGAMRCGYTPEQVAQALIDKIAINETRTWPDWRSADPNLAIEHVKEGA